MAQSANNLEAVLQDTADAIRGKTGGSSPICPRDFADEIASIPTGGGGSNVGIYYPYLRNDDQQQRSEVTTVGEWVTAISTVNYTALPDNALTMTVLLNGVKYKIEATSGPTVDTIQINVFGTADDGANWNMISCFFVPVGGYIVFGSCQILAESHTLWYNHSFYWTNGHPIN